MNQLTRDRFASICYGVPKQIRGHVPEIVVRGRTMKLRCSCGFSGTTVRYGNRGGHDYAIAALFGTYEEHKRKVVNGGARP